MPPVDSFVEYTAPTGFFLRLCFRFIIITINPVRVIRLQQRGSTKMNEVVLEPERGRSFNQFVHCSIETFDNTFFGNMGVRKS